MKKLTARILDGNSNILVNIDKNAISIEYDSLDRGDLSDLVNYGIYSNNGKITFIDNDGSFKNLLDSINQTPSIMQSLKVQIYISSVVYSELKATFVIEDLEYNEDTGEVEISLKDTLTLWQEVRTPKYYWFHETSCMNILIDLKNSSFDSSFNFYVTDKARYVLNNTIIYCPLLNTDTWWSVVTKVCEATLCRVVCRADGNPIFYHVNEFVDKNIIEIRPHQILDIDNKISPYKTSLNKLWIKSHVRIRKENSAIIDPIAANIYELEKEYKDSGVLNWFDWRFVGDTNANITVTRSDTGNWGDVNQKYSAYVTVTARVEPVDNVYIDDDGFIGNLSVYGTYHFINVPSTSGSITITSNYNPITLDSQSVSVDADGYINITFTWTAANRFTSGNHDVWTDIKIELNGNYFYDREEATYTLTPKLGINDLELPSNELFQPMSMLDSIRIDTGILRATRDNYSQGIECCVVECLMIDYYYEDGTLAYDGSGISQSIQSFQKYDCVIPYVLKSGVEQPYRLNADGTPKIFKIIGIKYSFNGLLRQKLYLQEITNEFSY